MSKSLILLFLFQTLTLISTSPPPGLDSFLSSFSLSDPLSTNDSFSSLPSSLKRSLSQTLDPDFKFQITVPIYAKLVGSFSAIAPDILSSFVSAASSNDFYSVIGFDPSHRLSISHSLHLDPSHSHLSSRISSAIASYLQSSVSNMARSNLHSVPYTIVDDIIRKDFQAENEKNTPGFYIYFLNLDKQEKLYAYSYDDEEGGGSGTGSVHFSKCLGSLWTGKERYLWIDLAAGPVDYGPALSGDGVLPRGEFHALAGVRRKGSSEKVLVSDLGSLVLSAYKHLLVPSLRVPVHFETTLLVQFVHVHGPDAKDANVGLDFGFVEKTIRDSGVVFKNQELKFRINSVNIDDCAVCSFALSKSLSSYTSRFLFENYTLIVSEYMDSKSLRHILSSSIDEIHKAAGIDDETFDKVLPVYVFDLDYDKLLLLDRFHQAVAFKDMVVAVRTKVSQTVSDYTCNGRHVITQTRNLDRSIVASILQSMWGVSPTHLTWSFQHNKTLADYTWSVGQTPFGPFSESSSLSFVQRDAAKRNVLLSSLNYTISGVVELLDTIKSHGGERKLLKGNKYVEFVQRWNLLKYKLEKVISAMSHLDYEKAIYYFRSSDHDLYAVHTMIYLETQNLDASLVCFKDPPFPWASASISAAFVLGFFYAYSKKDKIFRSKRKQF